MLAFYEDISHGHHNEGLGHEITAKFENEADSHMMNLANLKGAIDVALDGHFGADVVPYNGSFIANEIGGEEILDARRSSTISRTSPRDNRANGLPPCCGRFRQKRLLLGKGRRSCARRDRRR